MHARTRQEGYDPPGPMEKITVYLEPQQFDAVTALAARLGCTVSDLIRRGIDRVLMRSARIREHAVLEHIRSQLRDPALRMSAFGHVVVFELPADVPRELVTGPLVPPVAEDGPSKMISTRFYRHEVELLERLATRFGVPKVAIISKGLELVAKRVETVDLGGVSEASHSDRSESDLTGGYNAPQDAPMLQLRQVEERAGMTGFKLYPREVRMLERLRDHFGTTKTDVIRRALVLLASRENVVE